jgi:hypothetical protein
MALLDAVNVNPLENVTFSPGIVISLETACWFVDLPNPGRLL